MMTNSKSWQTVVNPANLAAISSMNNNLAVVKKNADAAKEVVIKMKVINPKRYSFDDNGGGYDGL